MIKGKFEGFELSFIRNFWPKSLEEEFGKTEITFL